MALTCTISGKLIDAGGAALQNAAVSMRPVSVRNVPIFTDDGELVEQKTIQAFTDENGFFSITVIRNLKYLISIEQISFNKQVDIPDQSSVELKDL